MEENDKTRHILALLFAGVAFYLLIALWSHVPVDSAQLVYPATEKVSNLCGRVGAYFSERLLFSLGYGAYALVLMLLCWSVLFAMRIELPDLWARLAGSSLILVCVAVLISLHGPIPESSAMPGYGGAVGEATALYLQAKFGRVGTYVMAGMVGGISLVLATETLLVQGARRCFGVARGGLVQWGDQRRERMAQLREKLQVERAERQKQLESQRERQELEKAERVARRAEQEAERKAREAEVAAEREVDRERLQREKEEARRRSLLEEKARREDAEERKTKAKLEQKKKKAPAKKKKGFDIPVPVDGPYQLPPVTLLDESPSRRAGRQSLALEEKAELLESSFEQFGIQVTVVNIRQGPTIAQFECELGVGIKLSKVTALANDLAMALQATSVRIVAPLPGKGTFGVEIPNDSRQLVHFRELLEEGMGKKLNLALVLGKEIDGCTMCTDLSAMPHLLIAGTTGSGKSICVNSIIISLLYHRKPDELKFILVDPKQVELAPFANIPHLICPTVTDAEKAVGVLEWAVTEMEKRYRIFRQIGCRDISSYGSIKDEERKRRWVESGEDEETYPGKMPYVVIIVDELADLMFTVGKAIEGTIVRLAQKSRAAGLHLILATQRPSVDVATGLIKANMPCRLSFRVNSSHDSKVILDCVGADKLLGKGDMLVRMPEVEGLIRAQGAFLSEAEVARVVKFVAAQAQPKFHQELLRPKLSMDAADEDPLFAEAVRIVLEQSRGSASLLQRALSIGYTRASRLIDIMEERSILGPHKGSKAREIQITLSEWEEMVEEAQK